MSRQKFKYLENEKSFSDEVNSIFDHFWRTFIETNKIIFSESESPTLKKIKNRGWKKERENQLKN